jgi:hypothetical protein
MSKNCPQYCVSLCFGEQSTIRGLACCQFSFFRVTVGFQQTSCFHVTRYLIKCFFFSCCLTPALRNMFVA